MRADRKIAPPPHRDVESRLDRLAQDRGGRLRLRRVVDMSVIALDGWGFGWFRLPWLSLAGLPRDAGIGFRRRRGDARSVPEWRQTINRIPKQSFPEACHARENPGRQPRRDRLPGHEDGEAHGDRHRRRLFRGGPGCLACRHGGRGGRHRAGGFRRVLSGCRQDHRGLQGDRRGRRPSRLRLSLRKYRFRPRLWPRPVSSSSARPRAQSQPWATRSNPNASPRRPASIPFPAISA